LRIPVSPGRNVSSLIEVAARNRLLQVRGHHSAREFQERLDRALADARERRWRDDVE
jgi:HPr kinase/phosphorylase